MLKKTFAHHALNRTSPHPADPTVRIAHSPDDLAALHNPGIKAVIWQRELPKDIVELLQSLSPEEMGRQSSYSLPNHYLSSRFYRAKRPNPCPFPAIEKDELRLGEIFQKAEINSLFPPRTSRNPFHIFRFTPPGVYHSTTTSPVIETDRCDFDGRIRSIIEPHCDSVERRMLTVYCLDPDLGTVWYPEAFYGPGMTDLRDEIMSAESPSQIRRINDKYNAQQIKPGDVLYFKGDFGRDPDEALVHATPIPKQNVVRMLQIYPAF